MALHCYVEVKRSQSSSLLIRGLTLGSLSTEKLQKNCISMPQMTTGALAACCHLLSSLRCTDATCPQTGLLAELQVMVVPDGRPTWRCSWKGGAGTAMFTCGEGKVDGELALSEARVHNLERFLCFEGAPLLWVQARSAPLRGAGALGQCERFPRARVCFQSLPSAEVRSTAHHPNSPSQAAEAR